MFTTLYFTFPSATERVLVRYDGCGEQWPQLFKRLREMVTGGSALSMVYETSAGYQSFHSDYQKTT